MPLRTLRAALAAGAVGSGMVALAACGNLITTDVTGVLGMTADAQGHPVALVAPCGAAIDRIDVVAVIDLNSAAKGSTSPILTTLSTDTAPTGTFAVSLSDPAFPWTGTERPDVNAQDDVVVSGRSSRADVEATPVTIGRAAYASLSPDKVVVRDGEVWSRADFDAIACTPTKWPPVSTN